MLNRNYRADLCICCNYKRDIEEIGKGLKFRYDYKLCNRCGYERPHIISKDYIATKFGICESCGNIMDINDEAHICK